MTQKQAAKIIISNIVYASNSDKSKKVIYLKNITTDFGQIYKALRIFIFIQVKNKPTIHSNYGLTICVSKNSTLRLIKALLPYYPDNAFIKLFSMEQLNTVPNSYKSKHSVNKNYFSEPTIENSYWAGLIAADGCIRPSNLERNSSKTMRLTLHKQDESQLKLFNTLTKNTRKLQYAKNCVIAEIISDQICDDLFKFWSITPNKSLTLRPPSITDPNCIKAYLVGLIDGDGTIGQYHKNYNYWTIR